ncbi:isoamylase [Treponema primitia]|uniref:isoamylase n=1 Tax=Treponema primitia TaxID=88058 RepID=UPI00397F26D2
MRKNIILMLLVVIIGNIEAIDTESYQFINHLLTIPAPGAPEIFDDGVIFTSPSTHRRVGIAFAHEGFARVYWFQKLLKAKDELTPQEAKSKNIEDQYRDSGILFHVYTVPPEIRELEYRLVIDGLWTTDPLNPQYRIDQKSGIVRSMIAMPEIQKVPTAFDGPPGTLTFNFQAPSGEIVTVAGSFNGWDPFMYELKETRVGYYSLTLPLPPGTYHYVFFHRGQRILDPFNHNRVYTNEGMAATEAIVR